MHQGSVLQQAYHQQNQLNIKQQAAKKGLWRGEYSFGAIWMLIGMLVGGVPLAAVVTMYAKRPTSQSASTTNGTAAEALLRWNSTGVTVAGVTGVFDNAANQLNYPFGLAVDPFQTLYVADWYNNRVQKFVMGATNGSTSAGQENGSSGSSSSQLTAACDVVLNVNDDIYVADTSNERVQFYTNGGSSGTTVAGSNGSCGAANNQLCLPYSLARDPNSGALYISDYTNHRVMCYLAGASSGTVVAGGNGDGTNNTQLFRPVGLYFESSTNSLVIANSGANNVVRWVLGDSSWTLVAGSINGFSGITSSLLNSPLDVTPDPMGNVYVADTLNHRIQFFLAGQTNGTTIAGSTGVSGSNATLLYNPFAMALDSQLNIYVSDTYNARVQKFVRY